MGKKVIRRNRGVGQVGEEISSVPPYGAQQTETAWIAGKDREL